MKIFVKAKPNAREEKVVKIDETHYEISVRELPINGRANLAIFKVLSEYFKVPESDIDLLSGYKSKQKLFEIFQK